MDCGDAAGRPWRRRPPPKPRPGAFALEPTVTVAAAADAQTVAAGYLKVDYDGDGFRCVAANYCCDFDCLLSNLTILLGFRFAAAAADLDCNCLVCSKLSFYYLILIDYYLKLYRRVVVVANLNSNSNGDGVDSNGDYAVDDLCDDYLFRRALRRRRRCRRQQYHSYYLYY